MKFPKYINMVNVSREINERNGIKTIVDSNEIFWLYEKQIKNIQKKDWIIKITTRKYPSKHRKHRHEIVDKVKQNNQIELFQKKK